MVLGKLHQGILSTDSLRMLLEGSRMEMIVLPNAALNNNVLTSENFRRCTRCFFNYYYFKFSTFAKASRDYFFYFLE